MIIFITSISLAKTSNDVFQCWLDGENGSSHIINTSDNTLKFQMSQNEKVKTSVTRKVQQVLPIERAGKRHFEFKIDDAATVKLTIDQVSGEGSGEYIRRPFNRVQRYSKCARLD